VKALVTGGAGFIGSHLVDALLARGDEVLCVDSLDPGVWHAPPDYLRSEVDYSFADLRYWVPDERFVDVEAIFHFAALGGVGRAQRERANVLTANAAGTARLVEAASKWSRLSAVVLASSFSVYGANYSYHCVSCGARRDGSRSVVDLSAGRYEVACSVCGNDTEIIPISEDAAPDPLEAYGASKYMQELCWRGFEVAPVHVLRFSSAYGARLRLADGEATIIAKLAGWIGEGIRPKLLEDGRQIRDWVHVSDIVSAALTVVDKSFAGSVTNVCSGSPTRLLEACEILAQLMGKTCPADIVGGFRPGDMRHCLGDPTALIRLIGRTPVSFADGAASAFGTGLSRGK
jgi:dTDP-L-rhamnose 4-epimerase